MFQESVQFCLSGDAVGVSGEAPGIHDRGNGDVEGAAGGVPVFQGPGHEGQAVAGHALQSALPVQPGHQAVRLGPGELGFQLPDGILSGSQRGVHLAAVGGEVHHRVHGEDLGRGFVRLFAAACETQGRRQYKNETPFHRGLHDGQIDFLSIPRTGGKSKSCLQVCRGRCCRKQMHADHLPDSGQRMPGKKPLAIPGNMC